jgi:hypothetical protein
VSAVVAGFGAGVVSASPCRPVQPVVDGVDGVGDHPGEESPDLVECQRNQALVGVRVACVGGDDGEDGVGDHDQRDVPVPGVPAADLRLVQADLLAVWKQVSTFQRVPATRARVRSSTGRDDQQR